MLALLQSHERSESLRSSIAFSDEFNAAICSRAPHLPTPT